MFHNGKQVDAAADEPDESLKLVRGKRQANLWREVFGYHHFQALTGGAGGRFSEQTDAFVARAKAASAVESVFADDRLAAWCALAGLAIEAASGTADDANAPDA